MTTSNDVDIWSPLEHKADLADNNAMQRLVGQWVPMTELRRLSAYRVLDRMVKNVARHSLKEPNDQYREWGDPALIVKRIVALVLSDALRPLIIGGSTPPPRRPPIPRKPQPPTGDNVDEIETKIYTIQLDRWREEAEAAVEKWEADLDRWPVLKAEQAELDAWWTIERVKSKLYELEVDNVVPLGDGLIVMGWSAKKQRPTVKVYNPDAYFPVFDDATDEFPNRLHFAWEETDIDEANNGKETQLVRRITYRIGRIRGAVDDEGYERVDSLGAPIPVRRNDYVAWVEAVGDMPGYWELRRKLPWHEHGNDESYTTETCYLTDMTWRQNASFNWYRLEDAAVYQKRAVDLDLGFDEIPVTKFANLPASATHWAQSSLLPVVQLLEDLAGNSEDLIKATALAAVPMVGVSGTNVPAKVTVKAGSGWNLGVDGKLSSIDTASSVDAVIKTDEHLLDRLAVNTQLSNAALGRISDDLSGIAIKLLFGPAEQMAAVMRLTRAPQHSHVIKWYRRIKAVGLETPPDEFEDLPGEMHYGPIIPVDIDALVSRIAALLRAKSISRPTALTWLIAGGLTVSDAEAELDRIEQEDVEGAKLASEATGSFQVGADKLGIDIPDDPNDPLALPGV